MKTTKIITVTQKHIDTGVRIDPIKCPVAKAIRAAGFKNVSVGGTVCFGKNYSKSAALPKRVCNFITRFDREKAVKPFTFRLTY